MSPQQFEVLADILNLASADKQKAKDAIFQGALGDAATHAIVAQLRQADERIRGAYVIHGPMEFRVMVGHRDTHRPPGALKLAVGDVVRLTARTTERWVPVRITALPPRPIDYYMGVIVQQSVNGSRYAIGNGVEFSEDQVVTDALQAVKGLRRRRY